MPTTTTGKASEFITFSRTSNATVTDSDGKIKWAPHNLLGQSEQFDGSFWAKGNATITANTIAALNGTTTADTMTGTGSSPSCYQSYSAISATLTYAVYLKAGSNSTANLRLSQGGNGYEATFTLTGSGTAGSATIVGTGGTVTGVTSAISLVADGWYRCSLTYNETSSGNVMVVLNATSGTVYLWGAHLYRSDLGGMKANTSAYPMYNPTTAKNLLGFSKDFSNAAWVKTRATIVANMVSAPNGLLAADKLVEDTTASNDHRVQQTVPINGPIAVSVYMKAAERTFGYLRIDDASSTKFAYFNLASGTVGAASSGFIAEISSVGEGWYRCSARYAAPAATALGVFVIGVTTADATNTYTGNGTSGIYLWGAQLSDSASLDPYVPNNGPAPTAAAYYGPRLDYDPVTLAAKGLLVEELRSNLFLRSAEFDDANWQKQAGATVTANTTVAPDGTTTADTVNNVNGVASVAIFQTVTVPAVPHTYSFWVRAGTTSSILFGVFQTAFVTGTATVISGPGSISGTAAITLSGLSTTQWTRVSFTFTPTNTVGTYYIYPETATSGTGKNVIVWGAQLEAGSFATSYIPTGAATATRNADVASVSTNQFPYNATEGTLVISADTYDVGSGAGIIASLSAGLTSNSVLVGLFSNKTTLSATVGGSPQAFLQPSGTVSTNTVFKAGGAFGTNSFIASSNGTLSIEDPAGSLPAGVTTLGIGIISSTIPINGHIRQITYLPRKLSASELQARTA
jgi:hypothetical protein